MEGVGNARELGGYRTEDGRTVKHGLLLRTAGLHDATGEDIRILTKEFQLGTVVDFRTQTEIAGFPDPQIPGVKNVNIQILEGDEAFPDELKSALASLGQKGTSMIDRIRLLVDYGVFTDQLYILFLSSGKGKAGYSQFFRELLSLPEDRSILFHCTQGKDRTGCAAMLLLSALGVDAKTILEDYVLTNVYNAELIAREREELEQRGIRHPQFYLYALDQVNPAFMTNVIEWATEHYGSPLGYIKEELGVTGADIEQLKERFLTQGGAR